MVKTFWVKALLALAFLLNSVSADPLSLTSALVNSSAAGLVNPSAPGTPGLGGTLDSSTGLGTIVFTDRTPGAGFFNLFVDLALAAPFYNEYGAESGTPAPGQSWQIDVPDYWCNTAACQTLGLPLGVPDPNDPTANILANVLANSLNNQNGVPGTLSNFLNDCGAEPNASSPAPNASCNNDVALAMGFNYFVPAGAEEVISLTVSQTAPVGGFYLEQLHPADAANATTTTTFVFGSEQQLGGVPEPPTLPMLLTVGALLAFASIRKITV